MGTCRTIRGDAIRVEQMRCLIVVLLLILLFIFTKPASPPVKKTFGDRVKKFLVIWWLTGQQQDKPIKATPVDKMQNQEREEMDHGYGW